MIALAALLGSIIALLFMRPILNLTGKAYDFTAGRKLRQEAQEAAELKHLSDAFGQQSVSSDGRITGIIDLPGLTKKEKSKARLGNLMLTLMHMHADEFNELPNHDARYAFIITNEKHRDIPENIQAYRNAAILYLQHRLINTGTMVEVDNNKSFNAVTVPA